MIETVLVTGISGFIAKHVALELLKQGHNVRGTVRSPNRADSVRKTLAAHGGTLPRLSRCSSLVAAKTLSLPRGKARSASSPPQRPPAPSVS